MPAQNKTLKYKPTTFLNSEFFQIKFSNRQTAFPSPNQQPPTPARENSITKPKFRSKTAPHKIPWTQHPQDITRYIVGITIDSMCKIS